jgi:hypothetical protein
VSRGQHAAADGSFNRSAGSAMARGIALIVAAVLIGVVLLRSTDGSEPFRTASGEDDGGTTDPTGAGEEPGDGTEGEGGTTTTVATAHDPAQVTVLVANGTRVAGAAGRITETLKASNFVTAPPGNTASPAEASAVYFAEGYEADANVIAGLLNPAPSVAAMPNPPPVADLAGAHVLVVLGADLAAG